MITAILLLAATAAAAPDIPGITAKDAFPAACVGCHLSQAGGKDVRISKLLARWDGKADPKALAAMQGYSPKAIALKGKHPPVPAGMLKDVPASCAKCHTAQSKSAPPLAPLMHGIHFGRNDSPFLKEFHGECTHCHKLNRAAGTWSIPSGAEK